MPPRVFPEGGGPIVAVPRKHTLDLAFRVALFLACLRTADPSLFPVEVRVDGEMREATLSPILLPGGIELAILTVPEGDGSNLFVIVERSEYGWNFPEGARVARDTRELDGLAPSEILRILGH